MNPLEWLKALYEAFGAPYPKLSMIAVMILGALCFGGVWLLAAKQVEKSRPAAIPRMSGPASTSGAESPANTGNGNEFNYGAPPKEQKPSDQEKP